MSKTQTRKKYARIANKKPSKSTNEVKVKNNFTERELRLMRMTSKQKKFIEYYVETKSQTEAAILAGYSEKTADRSCVSNMRNPVIMQEINRRLKEKARKEFATSNDVMKFYTDLLKGEMEEEVVVIVKNDDGTTEPKIVKKKASIRDRGNAAKELSNILKITTNILQITQSNQNNILSTIAEKIGNNASPEDKDMVDFLEGDLVDDEL